MRYLLLALCLVLSACDEEDEVVPAAPVIHGPIVGYQPIPQIPQQDPRVRCSKQGKQGCYVLANPFKKRVSALKKWTQPKSTNGKRYE
jgi:hypothetical protein